MGRKFILQRVWCGPEAVEGELTQGLPCLVLRVKGGWLLSSSATDLLIKYKRQGGASASLPLLAPAFGPGVFLF